MTNSLLNQATNPQQYDQKEVNWKLVGSGIEDPWRFTLWSYIKPYALGWNNKLLIDIGTGTGWLLNELEKLGVKGVGIEPSHNNLQIASKLYPQIKIVETTLEDFSTVDKYDIVTAVLSFPHIGNLENAFLKINSLLFEHGQFLLIDPDYQYALDRPLDNYRTQYQHLNKSEFVVKVIRPQVIITDIIRKKEVYIETAKKTGFSVKEIKGIKPTQYLISKEPKYKNAVDMVIHNLYLFEKV